jgi:hypothetical protein
LSPRPWLAAALLLPLSAAADEKVPHRCEAVYMGPVEGCSLDGPWTVTSTGKTEAQARKTAEARLQRLITAAAEARALQAAGTVASITTEPERTACPAVAAAQGRVYCTPDPELARSKICFASFDDAGCYGGMSLDYEGPAWKVLERGAEELCAAAEAWKRAQPGVTEAQVLQCTTRCLREVRLRCAQ